MSNSDRSFNVVGLISGGKDSFFSLLHCMANNHQIVALANLCPPEASSTLDEVEDLNSFMYQTAGHGIVPYYSEALGLPLYRQVIQGSALNQSKEYHNVSNKPDEDETESLIPLLRNIIRAHPTANAICSGAILSTYQRTRVESVAQRLNLIPLSYLWQYPALPPPSPGGLLNDMAAAGFDVRLVKVASGGLYEELLWENLLEPRVRGKLQKAVGRFGGSVLGEGGEYETLVIDGPMPFWKKRIVIERSEKWTLKGGGGEASMGFTGKARLSVKIDSNGLPDDSECKKSIRVPGLWDLQFNKLIRKIARMSLPNVSRTQDYQIYISPETWRAKMVVTKSPSMLRIHNMTALEAESTASKQMALINSQLLEIIGENGLANADNLVFTTIVLRTMADFASVNGVYEQLFARPNPPARVTVACGNILPPSIHVMVSFVVCLEQGTREGLHVQSRSYWAPANIGPYSQAISIPLQRENDDSRLVYIAGQIPLVPATMEVLQLEGNDNEDDDDYEADENIVLCQRRMCLALQHMWRIGQVMKVGWWTGAVAFVTGVADVRSKALMAWKTWEEVHQAQLWEVEGQNEDDEGLGEIDQWDKRHGGLGSFVNDQEKGWRLPDFKRFSDPKRSNVPHFFAVQVDELPRGCEIEWQSLGIAPSDSGEPDVSLFSYMAISWDVLSSDDCFRTQLNEMLGRRQQPENFDTTIYTPRPDLVGEIDAQVIPCRSIWGSNGTRLAAGIAIRY